MCSVPLQFFHNRDLGEVKNRFSQDMEKVDVELPLTGLQASFGNLTLVPVTL